MGMLWINTGLKKNCGGFPNSNIVYYVVGNTGPLREGMPAK